MLFAIRGLKIPNKQKTYLPTEIGYFDGGLLVILSFKGEIRCAVYPNLLYFYYFYFLYFPGGVALYYLLKRELCPPPHHPNHPPHPKKPTGGDRLPDRAAATVWALQCGAGNSAFPNDLRGSCGAIWQTTSGLRLL